MGSTLFSVDLWAMNSRGDDIRVRDADNFWHSDSSHHEVPVKVTILRSVTNPLRGGDASF